jgi:amino acid adenylation domain-containing protein
MSSDSRTAAPSLLHGLLDAADLRWHDRIAIVTREGSMTYGELAASSRGIARWLVDHGVGPGDRVATLLPNGTGVVLAAFAASRIGAVFSVLEPGLKPYGLTQILADCEPSVLLTQLGAEQQVVAGTRVVEVPPHWGRELLNEVPEETSERIAPSSSACLIYTSGTTSTPKAVDCSHEQMLFAASAIQQVIAMRGDDVVGDFLPLAFDYGLYQVLLCCQVGATLVLGDRRDVGPGFVELLCRRGVTGLPLVPSMAAILVRLARRNPARLPPLRFVTNTGAHLSAALIDEIRTLAPSCLVYSMYGLTECKRVAILPPQELKRRPGSVGRPLPGTHCEVVGADGAPVPPGEHGELVVRGPHVMRGYWRDPELTGARFRDAPAAHERALLTGDICSLDADGFIYFHGRRDEIYKHRDRRISTIEVEAAALDVAGVLEAAVVPPNSSRGPCLFVGGDVAYADVLAGLRERLEAPKVPDHVVVLAELPRRATGKPDRRVLAEYADTDFASQPADRRSG